MLVFSRLYEASVANGYKAVNFFKIESITAKINKAANDFANDKTNNKPEKDGNYPEKQRFK